ncbi:apolipoprotein N-acyltransferase [Marinagarivorans cellulosilyticus]|uniref:Apolipoprotein N-acyltransferase n=1 Tax=Marinagarivorans cellulosilyticus TaxID=2721545 RepID=A0AAN1WLN7_9GAMM|nr:apolipoprotein N-acyltransferase [Marinagarivorans cellulosilyticus]BCD99877.1 apolipoprotein N-acyltransferase [Marinagarivorans cellulosilyticus]
MLVSGNLLAGSYFTKNNNACLWFILALLNGLIIGLPFVFNAFYIVGWFSLAPVFMLAFFMGRKRYSLYCLVCLFSAYAVASHWLVNFFHLQGMSFLKAVAWCSLYWLFMSVTLAALLLFFRVLVERFSKIVLPVIFASVVTAHCAATSFLFPANWVYSQGEFVVVLQWVALLGEYGLMFVMVLTSAATGCLLMRFNYRRFWGGLIALIAFWFSPLIFSQTLTARAIKEVETVTLGWVQTDSLPGQRSKLTNYSLANPIELQLSMAIADQTDVIIWPETGAKELWSNTHFHSQLNEFTRSTGTSVVLQDIRREAGRSYNSLMHVAAGQTTEYYDKRYLIPIGEFIPDWLAGLGADEFLLGDGGRFLTEGGRDVDFTNGKFLWRSRICYEAFFSSAFAAMTKSRPIDFATISSNQAWFNSASQVDLMKAVSRIRAVQLNVPVLHVNNNGPSWLFDADGHELTHSPAGVRGAFFTTVVVPKGR